MRGKADIEPLGRGGDRSQIIITEIPYQLNKASMVEKIAQLARDRKIEGISDVRDESDRQGLRVVVELRTHADPAYVLSNLYEQTPLQMAYNMNMLALVDGQPQVLTIRDILHHYIEFRVEVVTRRAPVRPEQGPRPRPHPRGPPPRHRQPGRGHRPHPRLGRPPRPPATTLCPAST